MILKKGALFGFLFLIYKRKTNFMTEIIGRVGWRSYVSTNNPLWDNLVSYYSADDTANDSKGANNGALVNGATYAAGKINNGFSLDGINDYVSFANNSWNYTGDFSMSFWIKPTNSLGYQYVIENFNYAGNFYGWMVLLTNNQIRFEMYTGTGGFGPLLVTDAYINTGAWNHVVISRVGSTGTKIYINNVLRASDSNTINPVYHPTRNYSRFGAETLDGGANYYHYNGSLDEVGIWNKALTAAEVAELYNAGAGKQYVAPVPSYTARTSAFATATGITDATILNALNTFDTGLISNGLDTKMKALYPFVGGTANTHKFNFMNSQDTDAAFRLSFNGGWIHSSTGAKPNGTNGYANTFLIPETQLSLNSNSYGFYSRTEAQGEYYDMGAYSYPRATVMVARFNGSFYALNNDDGYDPSTSSTSLGFLISSRTGANIKKGYRNNIEIQNSTRASVGLPTLNIYLGGISGYGGFTPREFAFAFMGNGLNAVEIANFTNLVNTLQTSLSRAV